MDKRFLAILAALGGTTIYALNHTIAKDVMPTYVQGFGFIMIRLIGGTALFWAVSLFLPKQPIARKDFKLFFRAAFLGMAINMLAFFKGLEYSTPINSTVIITTTPIMVFLFSALLLKEQMARYRVIGVLLGFLGALSLILFNQHAPPNAPNIGLGNFLFVVNASAYGLYLIVVKPLSEKYNTIHLLKWLFLIGLVISSPFALPEFLAVDWQQIPLPIWWRIGFVVLGTNLYDLFADDVCHTAFAGYYPLGLYLCSAHYGDFICPCCGRRPDEPNQMARCRVCLGWRLSRDQTGKSMS